MRVVFLKSVVGLVVVLSFNLFVPATFAQTSAQPALATDALLNQLPGLEGWRTFAKPLALGTDSLLMFQRDGGRAVMWRIDWKQRTVTSTPLPEVVINQGKGDLRYTALASEDGLWLLGETTLLIRPDGQRLTLKTGYDEPVAVVLKDQSVLVLGPALHGKNPSEPFRLQQVRLLPELQALRLIPSLIKLEVVDRGLLSYDGRPNVNGQVYRSPRFGHGAITLRDGRVLMFGGDVTAMLASVIEPRTGDGAWGIKPLPAMPNGRVMGVATLLPDGRVAITGAPGSYCYQEAAKTRSLDVYDAQNNRWSSLPPLPFVPCSDAYGADTPSITTTPNGSIVVGAYLEPQVMVLPRDASAATGYAGNWLVHGRMGLRRISGVVQALSDQAVVVAGGVDNQRGDFGGCCHATSGFDRINFAETPSAGSLAMKFIGAGVAQRGQRVFAASGRRFGFTSTGQMRYSAYAELMDLSTGKLRQLPNVPFVTGAAQAFWLDDDRVLLKGFKESNGRGFDANDNLSSSVPPSSAAMAICDVKKNRWSDPIVLPALDRAELVAAEGNVAWLLTDMQEVLRLDLVTHKVEVVQHFRRGRRHGVARFLPPDHLVVAGGWVQSEAVPLLNPDCDVTADKDCPVEYAGIGPFAPVALVEALSLDKANPKTVSTLSAAGPDHVISTVITAQGRAIVLSKDPQNNQLTMARSSLNGQSWDTLPLPSASAKNGGERCDRCALMVAPDPRKSGDELVFFREGAIDADYIDDAIGKQSINVWWWDETQQNWLPVLQGEGMSTRASPLALGEPLSPRQGQRMLSMGWHLRAPVVWMAP